MDILFSQLIADTDMVAERLSPLELMTKLVSFPTVSRDSNLDLVAWVEDYRLPELIHIDNMMKRAKRRPFSPMLALWLRVALCFPVTRMCANRWSGMGQRSLGSNRADGKYIGRGVCDMKGFDALAIWLWLKPIIVV